MCQSCFDIDTKQHLGNAREFAAYLGIEPEALITSDDEPMPELDNGDWRDACLCPFDVEANLDRAGIWHKTSEHDSMMVLAKREFS